MMIARMGPRGLLAADDDPDAYFAAYDAAKRRLLRSLLSEIDLRRLTAQASRLRGGIPCCTLPNESEEERDTLLQATLKQTGGQNCHLDITFEDGVVWLARVRLCNDPTLPPQTVQDHIFHSEVATLLFLEQCRFPAAKVYAYDVSSSSVGVPFMITDKLAGHPHDWASAAPKQRTKVMQQLADIHIELEHHPFDATGSLIDSQAIGAFAQPTVFSSPTSPLGPFTSVNSALSAMVHAQLAQIEFGELSIHPIDNYLAHQWRLNAVPRLHSSSSRFFLKHFDDTGDHILVDVDFNITGVIDWEFASTEVKELAFSSPLMMWPVAKFYEGSNCLASEELEFAEIFRRKGRDDLADLTLRGRKWQRLYFFLGGGGPTDQDEVASLFQGLRESMHPPGAQKLEDYSEWRQNMISEYAERHPVLRRLLRDEHGGEHATKLDR
ncbi:MAG: hypothetical protein M4579_001362 [Chaenotheca gracillima]|nr:MAG: hypothetical protein M4579_001362 [Chaenotheca gracillima]